MPTTISRHSVFVIDDNPSDRHILRELVESVHLSVKEFSTVPEFLNAGLPDWPSCIVTDVRLPVMSGLELLETLSQRNHRIPTILISGHADVDRVVQAMKLHAEDFIIKPVPEQKLLDVINRALRKAEKMCQEREQRMAAQRTLASLTDRERNVFDLLVTGKPLKAIAAELGISNKTLAIHRTHIQQKLGINNVVDMLHLIAQIAERKI